MIEARSAAEGSPPFNVLVIDDNRDFVEFLNLLLSHDGFHVHWTYNGPDGLEWLRQHPVDLVILDVMMPKMDGLTVCRELKNRHPALPVILLTAKDDMATRAEAIKLGVCEFLAKPVNIEDLMTRVRTQCQICQWDKNLQVATGEGEAEKQA
ncbi:MAG TPA: response regulator [Methylomirabilota bacterium]|nr:response regulator [Methylomirabilota bacterium]